MVTQNDVEIYLDDCGFPFEAIDEGMWRVESADNNVDNIILKYADPILFLRVKLTKVPQKQRAKQRCNMQAVGVGVGQNANLVITKTIEAVVARIDAQRDGYVMHFLGRQDFAGIHFPGIQNLAAERHDRL